MLNDSLTIADLGEHQLLQRLHQFCPAAVVGDDGAVLAVAAGMRLVVTTDVLVEGVHFSDPTTPPAAVGWRSLAANLSDLAAMGATPIGFTIGLSLPPTTRLDWIEALYTGMKRCGDEYDAPMVGGDVTRSPTPTIAITAFGQVTPDRVISRRGAQVGDRLLVTGYHGNARAGLELLLNPDAIRLAMSDRALLIHAHQYPRPRLDCLPILANYPRIIGMDSSDGLADAVLQLCALAGLGARLNTLPIDPMLRNAVGDDRARDWALYGGEDFELVLILPPDDAIALLDSLGPPAQIIGTIIADPTVQLCDRAPFLTLNPAQRFQHFTPTAAEH
ncbi:thiamine-phosphate kinase [Spirulina major CS-329]|uniref:thiamine-phosphate kinase n=1 Tax=Spirulina TaxID=1154 RepID=UPI00232B26D7|nr:MULTISPECIES: thiamine-phosphate kinase [Spirulina]MDB9495784.1 thiamine-phosphate kinase [Spirulina subsalsa CS-330]MDB9503770.1 thiamine-phosphate kinase [Spirulina major CS-329]